VGAAAGAEAGALRDDVNAGTDAARVAGAGVGAREEAGGTETLPERRLLRAMLWTFSQSSCLTLSGLREMSSKFFGRKSTAPASSATSVTRAPSLVSEQNINTGVGQRCLMCRTAEMPSIVGIS